MYPRFVTDREFHCFLDLYFDTEEQGGLARDKSRGGGTDRFKGKVRSSAAKMQPQVLKRSQQHGIGLHSEAEMTAAVIDDLEGIAAIIGGTPGDFLFGDLPCSFDAAVFGHLNGIVHSPFQHPVHQRCKELPELVRFVNRIRSDFYGLQ